MSDSGSSAPPGWYPDGQGGQRWWDGTAWGPEGQPPPEPEPEQPPEPEVSPPTMAMPTSPPPAYAPPGFPPPGQEASPAGASSRNPKVLLAILGGLVGVLVLVVVLVLVLSGGNSPSSDDPAETVASFFDAAEDGDCEAAFALLTDDARKTFGAGVEECEEADPAQAFGEDVSIDIGEAEVDGDTATVPVTLVDDSGGLEALGLDEITLDFGLEKQAGAWFIDDLGLGSLLQNLPGIPELSELPELSDFPENPFSDLPTELFSDFPSDFPTDLFSDFPTDFPTDFDPEDFMSDFPTDLFSDFPTE